jgi:hypothetical protein
MNYNFNFTYIYGISEENNENIRYVGKSDNPQKRLRQHIQESKNDHKYKSKWIQSVLKKGKNVKVIILEKVKKEEWKEKEIYWIDKLKNNNLTNHAKGGNGGQASSYSITYQEAKKWVKENFNYIKSSTQWYNIIKKENLPIFIPASPKSVFQNKGWISWGDFLGTNSIYLRSVKYISFEDAKKFIKLNLTQVTNCKEWRNAALNNKIPKNIPRRPQRYYKNRGWVSWGDFLGTGVVCTKFVNYIFYKDAKKYIKKYFKNITSEKEWRKNLKNKKIPNNIPGTPQRYYKNKGWISWGDFLGTGRVSNLKKL